MTRTITPKAGDSYQGNPASGAEHIDEKPIALRGVAWSGEHAKEMNLAPAVLVIAIILGIGFLYLTSALLVPITVAVLAYLTLRPIIAKMCGMGFPKPMASGILIFGLFLVFAAIAAVLYSPAQQWLHRAPEGIGKIRDNFQSFAQPLTVLDRAEEKLTEASGAVSAERSTLEVRLEKPDLVDSRVLINTTGRIIAFIAAIAVLTFFMLASGDDLLNRILSVIPNEEHRHELVTEIGCIQESVGRYLSQITCINIGLGVVVSMVMWAVGMPTPLLWGVLAALFNFIPYVGPLAATVLVFLAAGSTFDSIGYAGFAAVSFWLVTAVEGQFVTPSILGRTLKVGPVVVLIAVASWGFLWGLPGVFLAVPLLIVQREIFGSFPATYPIAVVLGEDTCTPGVDCEPVKDEEPIAEAV